MGFELQWLLWGLPVAFALGWLASRWDVRQWRSEQIESPKAYFKGLNLLLNEQQDKAIDAFIEAMQQEPGTSDLHFALGNLFRRRGEYERAVRVHEHLLARADLPSGERERAQHALAQDYLKAGLFDRAEQAFKALEGTGFATDAQLALLSLYERARDWRAAIEVAMNLEQRGTGSFAPRVAHYWCELALEADARQHPDEAESALARARETAPQAARPLVVAGQRAMRQGAPEKAMLAWGELLTIQPAAFALMATDFARAAQACHQVDAALESLKALYARVPTVKVLQAITMLIDDPAQRRTLLTAHLQDFPSLSAAQSRLQDRLAQHTALSEIESERLLSALTIAAKPLQRYRCAACGFEAQHYFWQCPGCQAWDSYPPTWAETA